MPKLQEVPRSQATQEDERDQLQALRLYDQTTEESQVHRGEPLDGPDAKGADVRTIREAMDDRKRAKGEAIGPPVIVVTAKGKAAIRRETEVNQRRGYVLESALPQGRSKVVLTFRLPT